ncbi:MAG: DUF438 domain-containing protein [Acidobacteria bacterium]|nr:DUF438 domain-containing protein [Acidobacteriota bacterium]
MSELLDTRRSRREKLKEMIRRLHDGADPEVLKEEFREILADVGTAELSAMETELMEEGLPQEEVQRMCDVHALLFRSSFGGGGDVTMTPGHPVHTFRLENQAIIEIVGRYREVLQGLRTGDGAANVDLLEEWRRVHDSLARVDNHYQRKEHLVFPYLEKAGLTGPPKVMWGVDDEIRSMLKAVGELLESAGELHAQELDLAVETLIEPMLRKIESMVEKEDRILWPMALEHLSQNDWQEVVAGWREFGELLAEPAGIWLPLATGVSPAPGPDPARNSAGAIALPSGGLSVEQLTAMLNTLPVDITFVDAEDTVAYFSEGPDRVFARSRTVLGRKVQNCHPPKSLHIVQRIVDEFREGTRDVAEFWIQQGGRFVHIRYFPVRAADGRFLGTLEMTQDVTAIRALEGERRLLDDEAEEKR